MEVKSSKELISLYWLQKFEHSTQKMMVIHHRFSFYSRERQFQLEDDRLNATSFTDVQWTEDA